MKCPLIKRTISNDKGGFDEIPFYCIQKECAWWNEFAGRCAVLSLDKNLAIIASELHWLVEKMPQKE